MGYASSLLVQERLFWRWPLCKYLHDGRINHEITQGQRPSGQKLDKYSFCFERKGESLGIGSGCKDHPLLFPQSPRAIIVPPLHLSQHSLHPIFEWSPSLTRPTSLEGPVGCQDSWPPSNHGLMSRSSFTLTFNCAFTTVMFCA